MVEEYVAMSDGCRLWTARDGTGPPVIFVHGGPGLWDMFGDVADGLSDVATTYRWDQRGCGRSQEAGLYTLERTLADLDELRAHFGHEQITLVGHSWGADLALRYASAYLPNVARLVCVSVTGIGRTWTADLPRLRRFMSAHKDLIDELLSEPPSPERDRMLWVWRVSFGMADQDSAFDLAMRLFEPYFTYNEKYHKAMAKMDYRLAEEQAIALCQGLDVPTLLIHGACDPYPPALTDSLVASLPRIRRVVLDGAGHYPWAEQLAATIEALRAFLANSP